MISYLKLAGGLQSLNFTGILVKSIVKYFNNNVISTTSHSAV